MPMLLPIVMSLDLMLAAGAPAPEAPCQADLVAINGHVYTVNASQPWAEAIAVCGERIARVGTTADVLAIAGPNARRIDLQGRTVIPGFNDSHVHLVDGGTELTEVDLRDAKSGAEGGRADRGVCEEAAERPLDPRRLLGSRALAGAAAADARAHRRRDPGQPGVRAAPRRAHGAGQQPGAEAGRHHARDASPERRRDREGRRRGADRHPEGQRQRPHHEGHAAGDARRDHGAGAGRAAARGLGRRDDRAGHDGERHRAARLPDPARAGRAARAHHVHPEPQHRGARRRRRDDRVRGRLAAHRRRGSSSRTAPWGRARRRSSRRTRTTPRRQAC